LAATLHKGRLEDARAIPVDQALRMATLEGARALGVGDRTGSLEVGKWADFVILGVDAPHARPMFDPATHLVYSASKGDVEEVFVGGRQVVGGGRITSLDLEPVQAAVADLQPAIAATL
jgi:5-methylthioadenosine/S-adenosylhomocysteine deaminase